MKALRKYNWKVIIRWVGTFLSFVLLIELVRTSGSKEFFSSLQKLSAIKIFLVLVLIFVSRIATFLRWHILLQIDDMHVDWKDSLRLTFAGLFAANFLPSTIGGDVVRMAGAMRIGIRGSLAAASMIVDRLIGMFGMALMLPFSFSSLPLLFGSQSQSSNNPLISLTAIFWPQRAWQKMQSSLKKVVEALRFWVKHPGILAVSLLFSFIHMAAIFGIIQLLIVGMDEQIGFFMVAGLWSLVYFITLVPVSINGLGLQELSITTILPMLGGVSYATSLSVALILRGLWIIGSLPGAFFVSGIISGEVFTRLNEEDGQRNGAKIN